MTYEDALELVIALGGKQAKMIKTQFTKILTRYLTRESSMHKELEANTASEAHLARELVGSKHMHDHGAGARGGLHRGCSSRSPHLTSSNRQNSFFDEFKGATVRVLMEQPPLIHTVNVAMFVTGTDAHDAAQTIRRFPSNDFDLRNHTFKVAPKTSSLWPARTPSS